jgi:hypothetical protein
MIDASLADAFRKVGAQGRPTARLSSGSRIGMASLALQALSCDIAGLRLI